MDFIIPTEVVVLAIIFMGVCMAVAYFYFSMKK